MSVQSVIFKDGAVFGTDTGAINVFVIKVSTVLSSPHTQTTMKTIFYFLASVKSFDQIMGFHERIHELHNCAKANDDIIVPDECIAQKGLRRHRRSFDHVFYKSKAPDLCGLPCQKSRLYTTPEVRINRKKRNSLERKIE